MYFSRQFITSLKKSITLEKLIGQFIELEKHGDHFIGLCPFHDDHHPSFTVFPNTQTFYYFGCHAGSKQVTKSSDHIAFLMSFFKLSFPQAIVKSLTHHCQIKKNLQRQLLKNPNKLNLNNPKYLIQNYQRSVNIQPVRKF